MPYQIPQRINWKLSLFRSFAVRLEIWTFEINSSTNHQPTWTKVSRRPVSTKWLWDWSGMCNDVSKRPHDGGTPNHLLVPQIEIEVEVVQPVLVNPVVYSEPKMYLYEILRKYRATFTKNGSDRLHSSYARNKHIRTKTCTTTYRPNTSILPSTARRNHPADDGC